MPSPPHRASATDWEEERHCARRSCRLPLRPILEKSMTGVASEVLLPMPSNRDLLSSSFFPHRISCLELQIALEPSLSCAEGHDGAPCIGRLCRVMPSPGVLRRVARNADFYLYECRESRSVAMERGTSVDSSDVARSVASSEMPANDVGEAIARTASGLREKALVSPP